MSTCRHVEGVWSTGTHSFPYLAHIPIEIVSDIECRVLESGVNIEIDHDHLAPLARAYLHANPNREDEMCMDIAVDACHRFNLRELHQPLQS